MARIGTTSGNVQAVRQDDDHRLPCRDFLVFSTTQPRYPRRASAYHWRQILNGRDAITAEGSYKALALAMFVPGQVSHVTTVRATDLLWIGLLAHVVQSFVIPPSDAGERPAFCLFPLSTVRLWEACGLARTRLLRSIRSSRRSYEGWCDAVFPPSHKAVQGGRGGVGG